MIKYNFLRLAGLLLVAVSFTQGEAHAQFKKGYYYDKDGKKVEGLLKFSYGGNAFTNKSDGDCLLVFRENQGAKKIKFTTNDICCFVIENDSFAIIKNFKLNAVVTYPQDFAEVIHSGDINLYRYYSIVQGQYGTTTVKDWVIEKNGKTDKLTRKKFKELLPTYLSDYPELFDKISRRELRYDDSERIIEMYNDFMMTKK